MFLNLIVCSKTMELKVLFGRLNHVWRGKNEILFNLAYIQCKQYCHYKKKEQHNMKNTYIFMSSLWSQWDVLPKAQYVGC